MFGLDMLDVAIGVIFLYLLLSLICTAVNEMIEAFLKKRADYLERGIRELLRNIVIDGNEKPENDLVEKIYNHAVIAGLYSGKYELSGNAWTFSDSWVSRFPVFAALWRRNLPTYIASEHFVQSLLDIISNPQNIKFDKDKLQQVFKSFDAKEMLEHVDSWKLKIKKEFEDYIKVNIPETDETRQGHLNLLEVSDYSNLIVGLEDYVSKLPNSPNKDNLIEQLKRYDERIKTEFFPLVTDIRRQFEASRNEIENWYNNAMDRVSGWYKRRAQIITFLLGLGTAIYINADTVTIVKRLSHDKATRESLLAASQEYVKANAEKMKAVSTSPAPATTPSPDIKSKFESCKKDANSPECKIETYKSEIMSLGLPIGWKKVEIGKEFLNLNQLTSRLPLIGFTFEFSPYFNEDYPDNDSQNQPFWLLKLLGWLITGAAVSLGAPFWFDILNKFMVVRSTVKPKEKSKNEGQKD